MNPVINSSRTQVDAFRIEPGTVLAGKYRVVHLLGQGWEGEVYLVNEIGTGIERSVKLFYPQRNTGNRTARFYAKKLHKLRTCPILIQYHTQDVVDCGGLSVTLMVSEFVEGELLADFIKRQPGRRLDFFQGLIMLHELAVGIERIHNLGEYHGDLHDENIIVNRQGLGFEVRLLDLYQWRSPRTANIRQDVHDMIRLFYDLIGGRGRYAKHPPEVKEICCGLKKSLIDQPSDSPTAAAPRQGVTPNLSIALPMMKLPNANPTIVSV